MQPSELTVLRRRVAELEQQQAQQALIEATLREEFRRLNDLLEFSTDWIWEMDANTRFTFVNPKSRDLLGYEPADLVGKTPADISPPEERQRMATVIVPIIRAQQPFRGVETTNIHRDGQTVLVEISGIPLFDQHGTWCGYRGVTRDITERRQMEAALRQREASLNEAQRLAHLGNWEWDIATGILTWSDEVYRIFGHQPRSFVPTFDAFTQAIHPDDYALVQEAIQRSLTDDVPYAVQYRIMQPDGTERSVYAEGEQTRTEDGTPVRMFGIILDVTERVRAEEVVRQLNAELEQRVETRTRELLQNQQMLQTVMDALSLAIFWKDRDFVYRGSNQTFATLAGFGSSADLMGKTDYDLPWKPEEAEFFRLVDRRVMETDTPELDIEEPILTAQGTPRWLRTNKLPLHDPDGAVVGILGAFEDITERKEAEEHLLVFRAMAESSPDGIGLAAPDGTVTYANPAFRELFGYGEATIGMINVSLFTEEDQRDRIPALLEKVFTRGAASGVLTGQRKDGSTFPALVSPSVIRDKDGQVRAIPAIVRDMSEQYRQEAERAALQQQIIAAQRAALRELSSPLIPIADHVVMLPLIGAVDSMRAQQVMETLLEGVAQHRAEVALVDITGVAVVDTQVAHILVQAAQAVRLLGAEVVLTGIGAAMAQTLVHLGAELSGIVTRGSLQSGIVYALGRKRSYQFGS
ncbi:MAG: PAS domain S-box protein [Chloroflexaceae bacterium]|nr:PAS domain S-box protein [Chloroflexaceae bacterium]